MRYPFPILLTALTLSLTLPISARALPPAQDAADSAAEPLPVRAVTLFSSGVGYTQREGEVSGNATVPLTFRTAQINDILKSLVLLDDGGTVRPVVYAAKDPIGRTLQSFAVDVTQPTGRADLLNRLKGAQVIVDGGETVIAAGTATPKVHMEGQIVGVDHATVSGDGGNEAFVLSVLGDLGLQSARLDEVRTVRFTDERINREFREALGLLATGADDKRRQVTLHFDGEGKRRVRVGYVSEAPLWKVSYRLLIGGADGTSTGKNSKPYLQGWAMVENTSDEDWTGVHLSLVSGRPVSFIQDLYQPLYLHRPIVPPDVVAMPTPQLSEANIENQPTGDMAGGAVAVASAPAPSVSAGVQMMAPRAMAKSAGHTGHMIIGGGQPVYDASAVDGAVAAESVVAAATGAQTGELFAYNISTPVTLPRQQAAMIPIVSGQIGGDKVSVYNPDTDARFPLNAFRLKNNTGLHLKGGPVTLFDGGVYAGDARMEDIPPGDERLITYAMDLSVEGERQGPFDSGIETSLSLKRGVLIVTRKERRENRYTLRNKADQPRTVLIEEPFDAEYTLKLPAKFDSRTPSHYRFQVLVAPGKTEKLTVVTEKPVSETVALIDADFDALEVYTKRGDVSEKVKAALNEVLTRRRHIQDLQSQASAAASEVTSIDRDQDRVRKNMAALDKATPLYKRYVTQLDQQETRIQELRAESNRLREAAAASDRDLRAYLDTLNI